MGKRRKAREAVLESLYSYEVRDKDSDLEKIFEYSQKTHDLDELSAEFGFVLFKKVVANLDELDKKIAAHTENWDFKRLAIIDKNILRLGLAEFKYFPDIPKKVSIDESIELAKLYGSADSSRFVNGVLDALGKES
jgi:N utilization substance protein B